MLCVGVCLFTKKIDYLGCKCFVFTLFVLEHDTSTQRKKYRESLLRPRESVLRTLFLSIVFLSLLLLERFFPQSFSP